MTLGLADVNIELDGQQICRDLHFNLPGTSIGCLMGASGSGKTTLLRTIAGLTTLKTGTIHLDGELLSSLDHHVDASKRQIGMVFQQPCLFPHMDLITNIHFVISSNKQRAAEQKRYAEHLLKLVGLWDLRRRLPNCLSGGQQQRAAVVRALVTRPKLLLLDEPFSSVDQQWKEGICQELLDLFRAIGVTVLFATHSRDEAFDLADFLGVIDAGRLIQWDRLDRIIEQPSDELVARQLNIGNFVSKTIFAPTSLDQDPLDRTQQHFVSLDQLRIDPSSPNRCTVRQVRKRGSFLQLSLTTPTNETVQVVIPRSGKVPNIGESVGITTEPLSKK